MQAAVAPAAMMKRTFVGTATAMLCTLVACGSSEGPDAATTGTGGQSDSGGAAAAGGAAGVGGTGGTIDIMTAAWEPAETSTDAPLGRWGHAVARVDDTRAVLLSGTEQGSQNVSLSDAWLMDTSSGKIAFTAIEATGPEPRYCACAVWDSAREKVVAVGGRNIAGPMAPETWELDIDTQTWSQMDVPMSPPGVVGCSLAHSELTGTTYLFGGGSNSGFTKGTYRYDPDGPEWVELDAPGPSSRYDATMMPIDGGASLLLFAGSTSSTPYSDVWLFDVHSETWSEVAMTGTVPPGRRAPWMTEAPGGGFLVGLGLQGAQPLPDLWHLDLEAKTWTGIAYDAPFGKRAFTPAIPGGPNAIGMLIGGFDGFGPIADAWQLRLP